MRDPHLADEITQAVFIILARKAKSLQAKTILSGWLCRTARFASADVIKIWRRQQQREQEAYMQSTLRETENDYDFNLNWGNHDKPNSTVALIDQLDRAGLKLTTSREKFEMFVVEKVK